MHSKEQYSPLSTSSSHEDCSEEQLLHPQGTRLERVRKWRSARVSISIVVILQGLLNIGLLFALVGLLGRTSSTNTAVGTGQVLYCKLISMTSAAHGLQNVCVAPAQEAIVYEAQWMGTMTPTKYMGDPTEQLEQAWEALYNGENRHECT